MRNSFIAMLVTFNLTMCFSQNEFVYLLNGFSENIAELKESVPSSSVANPTLIQDQDESEPDKVVTKRKQYIVDLDSVFYYSLFIDLFFLSIILFGVYYQTYKRMDTFFSFILFNVVIFILTFVLNQVKISMGAAFGLFAVFSMLRYRTLNIGVRDMTYLFLFIAFGLVSGIQMEYDKLIILLSVMTVFVIIFDSNILFKKEKSKTMRVGNVELAHHARKKELIDHLSTVTGYEIHHVVTDNVDLKRNTMDVKIYYF